MNNTGFRIAWYSQILFSNATGHFRSPRHPSRPLSEFHAVHFPNQATIWWWSGPAPYVTFRSYLTSVDGRRREIVVWFADCGGTHSESHCHLWEQFRRPFPWLSLLPRPWTGRASPSTSAGISYEEQAPFVSPNPHPEVGTAAQDRWS